MPYLYNKYFRCTIVSSITGANTNILKNATIHNTDISYQFLFDANAQRERYFGMKKKYEYSMTQEQYDVLQQEIVSSITPYDTIIIPQSSNMFLEKVAMQIGKKVIVVKKNSIDTIVASLESQQFMKAEKQKLHDSIAAMGDTFKINAVAGNQRKRFVQCLFEDINEELVGNVLVFDDSVFSGYTLQALLHVVQKKKHHYDTIVMFSKQPEN